MRRLFGCAAVVIALATAMAGFDVAAAATTVSSCSGRTSVPHSKYKLKVDYAVLMTCKLARKLAVAASPKLESLWLKGVRRKNVRITGYPAFRCDDTAYPDQVGNFYFSCSRKLSAKRLQFVNWTFGPSPV